MRFEVADCTASAYVSFVKTMCGRYQLKNPNAAAELAFEVFGVKLFTEARYNVAPSQIMPVIAAGEGGAARETRMRWGLVPFWEKSEKPKLAPINARSEEAMAKPMFRQSLQKRRCAIPADGFYEWQKDATDQKTPFCIQLRGGRPFFFAGIYEAATDARPETYALLTTRPNQLVAAIHDRMPVILDGSPARRWVAEGPLTAEALADFAVPYESDEMEAFPVSRLVNNPRNDSAEVVARVGE